jgi:DNA modification methylase
MSVRILIGDVRDKLHELPDESVDCVVTSPPYWGLRDYGVDGQLGLERTLGEHLEVIADVFDEVRRVLKSEGTLWLNYGDCYATSVNGRSAADTKAAGNDDRTFRDKPFSTVGPIYDPSGCGGYRGANKGCAPTAPGRIQADGAILKPKDLCGIPWRVAFALQDRGWWLRQDIIWNKPNPMPESITDRCTKAHEYLFLLSKSPRYYYDAEAIKEPAETADIRRPYGSPGANMLDGRDAPQGQGKPRKIKMPDGWDTGEGAHGNFHRQGREKGKVRELGSKGDNTPDDIRSSAGARMGRGAGWRDDPEALALTRNKRSVWTVSPEPFPEAHFATFPPALIVPCLLAGCPEFTCSKCGIALDSSIKDTLRASTNGNDLSALRGGIPESPVAPGPEPILQPSMHGGCSPISDGSLRGMREASGAGSEESDASVLQPHMREPLHIPAAGEQQGLDDHLEGLSFSPSSGSSECIEGRLCSGTPAHNGGDEGKASPEVGSGASLKRRPSRQSAGEPPAAAEADARPIAEGKAGRKDHLPSLPRGNSTVPLCPRCGANLASPDAIRRGVVLDPFFGAGTTGLVADRLQRNCIGIELNPEYAAIAERRIHGDSRLFSEVRAA